MSDLDASPVAVPSCPIASTRDDRKSARLAAERVTPAPGAHVADRFLFAREVLRSASMRQAAVIENRFASDDPHKVPVFFLDGEPHRKKRAEIARFFTPTAIATRYQRVMERTTDALLARLRSQGRDMLDRMSFELAVAVAADIIGLTNSDRGAMARRIRATLSSGITRRSNRVTRGVANLLQGFHGFRFLVCDVRPAIGARRRQRGDDVISHLLDEDYSEKAILIECLTYAAAGMVTTREFIVMAAWHLFERDELRQRFITADEDDQITILEEILRLEPVASMLTRRAAEATPSVTGTIPADTLIAIDIRSANLDESVVGACPYTLDPDRGKRAKNGTHLSFGDGRHRCPGAQVALHETRVFLDRLFRVPGIRMASEPTLLWCDELGSYELRDATIACERA